MKTMPPPAEITLTTLILLFLPVSGRCFFHPVHPHAAKADAECDYRPLREVIHSTGPTVEANPLYHGYRYYNPETGKWLSRDRLQESGGKNLTAFTGNDHVDCIDCLGDKILNIDFYERGNSTMEEDGAGTWRTSLKPPWRYVGNDSSLGFEGGFGYGYSPVWSPFPTGPRQACGLYKWEAVARWLVPKDYGGAGQIPRWQCTATQVIVKRVDKQGRETIVENLPGPFPDGPSGQNTGVRTTGTPAGPCQIVKQYAWDAPRYAADPEKGSGYYFSGTFELKISDSENARALKFWISFYFDDEHPAAGVGQLTILESDHEVPR